MLKTKLLGAMVVAMGIAGNAVAANGFYAGASAGSMEYDICGDLSALGATSCDDKDSAWKLFGGYDFNQNFALEGAWVDLGEVSASGPGGSAGAEVDGFTVVAKGTLPLGDQFGVFAKAGFFLWEVEGTGLAAGSDDDGTDLTYGVGAQYMFTDQFGLVGEWERYDSDDDVDLLSLGVMFKF